MAAETSEMAETLEDFVTGPSKKELKEIEQTFSREELEDVNIRIGSARKEVLDELEYLFAYVCQSPLLKPKEEMRIANDMVEKRHKCIRKLSKSTLLTDEEKEVLQKDMRPNDLHELWRTAQKHSPEDMPKLSELFMQYNTKRDELILANTRLVVSVAKGYRGMGLDFAELIQAGNEGLIKAVDKFDPLLGNKLSTYATWWISQSIRRALSLTSRTIRLSPDIIDDLYKLRKVENVYRSVNDKKPSTSELADMTGFSEEKIKELKRMRKSTLQISTTLNTKGDSEDFTIESTIKEVNPDDQDRNINSADIGSVIDDALNDARLHSEKYTPRQQTANKAVLPVRYIEAWQRKNGRGGFLPDVSGKEIVGQMNITKKQFRMYCNTVDRYLQSHERTKNLFNRKDVKDNEEEEVAEALEKLPPQNTSHPDIV